MSPGVTSSFWMGDQLPTLDQYDGLHSALIGMMNGGISGFGISHSDIGGYTSINQPETYLVVKRDEEILLRWIEMSAFSDSLFRSHPSNLPEFNAQIWDNTKMMQFFGNFTKVFVKLGDYKMELMKETEATGVPMVRSLMLELDDATLEIDD